MRKITLALAAAAALSITAPAHAVTTLFSTDFESGLFTPFTATGQVGVNVGQDYVTCCGGTGSGASLTNHFASFGSGDKPSGTLESPSFDIVSGETYYLDFLYGDFGGPQETFTVDIGPLTFTFSNPPTNDLDNILTPTHVEFTLLTGGPATLSFHSSGGASTDSFLDNVVFTTTAAPTTAPVPEPATWAMMLLGFAGIGFAMRRQRWLALA